MRSGSLNEKKGQSFLKWVWRWSPSERKLRIVRFIRWVGVVGDGKGHSTMHTLSLAPAIYRVERGGHDFALTLLGVRYHWQRRWGGKHV